MLLKNKITVIYGGAGAIGSAVAGIFAREGAKVFVTGRKKAALEKVVSEITKAGGRAELAIVDASKEDEVEKNLKNIVDSEGKVDISFNAAGPSHKGLQGISLLDLTPEGYVNPVTNYLTSNFITARAAGRHMMQHKSGVILFATATAAYIPFPNAGGIAPAWAAMEALSRGLAVELGPSGVRCVCIRSEGMPETPLVKQVMDLHRNAKQTPHDLEKVLVEGSMLHKVPTLEDFGNMAAFMASDKAALSTAAVINVSAGRIFD